MEECFVSKMLERMQIQRRYCSGSQDSEMKPKSWACPETQRRTKKIYITGGY